MSTDIIFQTAAVWSKSSDGTPVFVVYARTGSNNVIDHRDRIASEWHALAAGNYSMVMAEFAGWIGSIAGGSLQRGSPTSDRYRPMTPAGFLDMCKRTLAEARRSAGPLIATVRRLAQYHWDAESAASQFQSALAHRECEGVLVSSDEVTFDLSSPPALMAFASFMADTGTHASRFFPRREPVGNAVAPSTPSFQTGPALDLTAVSKIASPRASLRSQHYYWIADREGSMEPLSDYEVWGWLSEQLRARTSAGQDPAALVRHAVRALDAMPSRHARVRFAFSAEHKRSWTPVIDHPAAAGETVEMDLGEAVDAFQFCGFWRSPSTQVWFADGLPATNERLLQQELFADCMA